MFRTDQFGRSRIGDQFGRCQAEEFIPEFGGGKFCRHELAGRYIDIGKTGSLAIAYSHRQVVVCGLVEQCGLDDCPGRDDSHNCPFDQSPGFRGVAGLLGNCDLQSRCHECPEVVVECVIGDSGERRFSSATRFPGSQGNSQHPRQGVSVFVKTLVKIAHPDEEKCVRVPGLEFQELAPTG